MSGLIHKLNIKTEAGYTLIELLVGICITAFLVGLIGSSIVQVNNGQQQIKDDVVATRNIQNLHYWLGRDIALADSLDSVSELPDPAVMVINLSNSVQGIGDYANYIYQGHIYYSWNGSEVWRNQTIVTLEYDDGGQLVGTDEKSEASLVADYIQDFTANITDENIVNISVSAEVGDHTQIQSFSCKPRLEG